ncbi:hypothetical protein GF068_06600 [Polyangium spumosum]|uniref:Uncharacterized protein n=2 Tax=Polyangium spumosum TaxID=889282 RepID=A0A6N7PHJ3_9BACT|nr:hypothetical protein [Polyangium spumosum]
MALSHATKGKPSKNDLEAKAALSYDGTNIFLAVDVTDDVLRGGGGDHVALTLGFPGGVVHEVRLFPGDPGKSAGAAKTKDGKAIAGAKVIEAPRAGGWTLEASIPWSAFPPATTTRVGLRGAIHVHDADTSSTVEAALGTAPSTKYESLPPVSIESEQALAEGLLKQKSVRGAPKFNLIADVAGDALKERVLVWDRYLIVLGPTFRKGTEYYWNDLDVDVRGGMLPSFEARDVTGDGQAELVLRKRLGTPKKYREYLQVLQFGKSDVPTTLLQHEIAIVTEKGAVENEVRFDSDGAKVAITVLAGKAKEFHAGNYHEPRESSMNPALLPWETTASRTYKWNGKAFTKAAEASQAATPPPAPKAAGETLKPEAPKGPSASELLEQVHALYKRERGVTGKPRFNVSADVSGDKQVESILLHDRDLVIFGKGFKGGAGYSYLSLSQFTKGTDITEVSAMDLTGDGKAEIIVQGTLHANASPEAGGGTVDRDVLLVYRLEGEGVKRVFAAEIGRAIGKKKVSGAYRFVKAGKGVEIELASGKATTWTAATYPFTQDTSATAGGIEPLLLPWSNLGPIRYRWSGSAFAR